jgi:DNA-binding NtrC family response regulator
MALGHRPNPFVMADSMPMKSRGRVLVVDDEVHARSAFGELLKDEGYAVETAADAFKALGKLEDFVPDVIVTDLKMPGLDGLAFLEKAKASVPHASVIVMTAFGTIRGAVEAMKRGADNYLTKPLEFDAAIAVIDRALEKSRLVQETMKLRERLRERNAFAHIVTQDARMNEMLELATQVGQSKATALVVGETGTGKELIAETIHQASPRAGMPFVRVHCASLSEGLLEAELFGHEKGAFAGAVARREGRFVQAEGGTLFLDEIHEMSLATQAKLLRVLEEKTFERVGGSEPVKVDVRLVAATDQDLRTRVKEGTFREDLFYRLNVMTIELPPLRERRTDIVALAGFFLKRYARENGKPIDGLAEDALAALNAYSWPGNVRELENVIEHAVVLCDGPRLRKAHLPPTIVPHDDPRRMPPVPGSTIHDLERYAILRTLEQCGGSTSKAAMVLGISARKIQYKLHEYDGVPGPGPMPPTHE